MKKLIVTCAVVVYASVGALAQTTNKAVTTPAQAPVTPLTRPQNNMTPEQRAQQFAENQAKSFERQYGLNATQYKDVYAACLEFANKMETQRTSGKQPTNQGFEAMMAEKDAKFKQAMTAEQYAKYESTRRRPVPQPGMQQPQPQPPVRK